MSTPPTSGPTRDGRAGRGAPDAERRAAILAAVGAGEERERAREHQARADALHATGEVEHQWRGGQPAQERGGREDADADHVDPPPPDAVGQRDPPASSAAASVSAYASITHLQVVERRVRSASIAGNATLTIVTSTSSMNVPRHTRPASTSDPCGERYPRRGVNSA